VNSLKTVIRLNKWQLDEKRRAVTELHNLRDQFLAQIERLEEEIIREREVARGDLTAARIFPGYLKAARDRRARLDQSVAQTDKKIAEAEEAVADAYRELKKFELAEEERVRLEKLKIRRKEDAVLDETAGVGFRRRKEEAERNA